MEEEIEERLATEQDLAQGRREDIVRDLGLFHPDRVLDRRLEEEEAVEEVVCEGIVLAEVQDDERDLPVIAVIAVMTDQEVEAVEEMIDVEDDPAV